ncbi:MAG: hypothetical protein JRN39_04555 [Nitrososphaerota archaeon]|nr:hypothetical protein [Nitrososphaerota archaeon]
MKALVVVLLLALSTAVVGHQADLPGVARPVPPAAMSHPFVAAAQKAVGRPLAGTSPAPNYDEQLGMTFTQDFADMSYNVTAVEQSDSYGYGPAYLLNGLSDAGYWYQVGLSWNWPYSGGGHADGFYMNYEVFDPGGASIFPSSGGGGTVAFSGPVNSGDTVLLSLSFSGGSITMRAHDWATGAQASVSYSAEGATRFTGSPYSTSNSEGFFTGLMTEEYHVNAYYGNEQPVTYSNFTTALASAWMWIDEFQCLDSSCSSRNTLFNGVAPGPIAYGGSDALHAYSYQGATEYSSAYRFITGNAALVAVTMSYLVSGGGAGYSPPALHYVAGGTAQTGQLGLGPTTYYMDQGSTWSVAPTLNGSSADERWQTDQPTEGVADQGQTVSLDYYHQYRLTFNYSVAGGGTGYAGPSVDAVEFGAPLTVQAPSQAWIDAGSGYSYPSALPGGTPDERWVGGAGTSGKADSPSTVAPTYVHQYYVTLGVNAKEGGTVSPQSGWYDAARQLNLSATAAAGWRFEGWSPQVVGLVTVDGPVNETAVFDPGLLVSVGSGGSVWYSYGSTTGHVGGGEKILYVPVNGTVSLLTAPSLFIYSFKGWSGAVSGDQANLSVTVASPGRIAAVYGYNYPVISDMVTVAMLASALAVAWKKRPAARQP